jgi:TRAP-type transport system periplasmic protein
MQIVRRNLIASGGALAGLSFLSRKAYAAVFSFKFDNNTPATHRMTVRGTEAAARFRVATNGTWPPQIAGGPNPG